MLRLLRTCFGAPSQPGERPMLHHSRAHFIVHLFGKAHMVAMHGRLSTDGDICTAGPTRRYYAVDACIDSAIPSRCSDSCLALLQWPCNLQPAVVPRFLFDNVRTLLKAAKFA